MLIKLVVALAIIMAMSHFPGLKTTNLKNSLSDVDTQNALCAIDEGIMRYYYNHSGQLPNSLSDINLKLVGLHDTGWSGFTYSTSGGKFYLKATLKDGSQANSPNSGKVLSDIYDEDSTVKIK